MYVKQKSQRDRRLTPSAEEQRKEIRSRCAERVLFEIARSSTLAS